MTHNNTVLHQMLKFVDKYEFQNIEKSQFRAKRKYRSLSRWGQFTTMLFAQITGRSSWRDITDSLQVQRGRLYHLGMNCVKKSTLADANNNRTSDFFHALSEVAPAYLFDGLDEFADRLREVNIAKKEFSLCTSQVLRATPILIKTTSSYASINDE